MKTFFLGIMLFLLSLILILPLTVANFLIVSLKGKASGYFMSTAVNLDRFGNYEFRTLFNSILIRADSKFLFGDFEETISSVLGKNKRAGTLSKAGRMLAGLLDAIEKGHCEKSIIETKK